MPNDGRAILTPAQVKSILWEKHLRPDLCSGDVAKLFTVSPKTIRDIWRGRYVHPYHHYDIKAQII